MPPKGSKGGRPRKYPTEEESRLAKVQQNQDSRRRVITRSRTEENLFVPSALSASTLQSALDAAPIPPAITSNLALRVPNTPATQAYPATPSRPIIAPQSPRRLSPSSSPEPWMPPRQECTSPLLGSQRHQSGPLEEDNQLNPLIALLQKAQLDDEDLPLPSVPFSPEPSFLLPSYPASPLLPASTVQPISPPDQPLQTSPLGSNMHSYSLLPGSASVSYSTSSLSSSSRHEFVLPSSPTVLQPHQTQPPVSSYASRFASISEDKITEERSEEELTEEERSDAESIVYQEDPTRLETDACQQAAVQTILRCLRHNCPCPYETSEEGFSLHGIATLLRNCLQHNPVVDLHLDAPLSLPKPLGSYNN
ncbi:hypothetical protein EJ02DRAFT_471053, partial [Clathrospora elynae]